jgi:uncharacterized protein YndB with AHSA1/START domain
MAATPEHVFAAIADPRTYPDWLVGAQHIRGVDADFPQPGSVFHHSVGPTDDATVDDISEVLAVDPPRALVLRVHVGRLRGVVELAVRPTATGSEVRLRETPSGLGRVVMPLVRPLLYGRNARSLQNLEDYLLSGRV